MAALTPGEKKLLPPIVEPFGRSNKVPDAKVLKDGESEYKDFLHAIYPAEFNEEPKDVVYVTEKEIETHLNVKGRFKEKCFLWVIDETMIRIIRENTRNVKRTHDSTCVCHTNLTGGEKAHVGGEMFFADDGRVFINPFSDRYGGTNISTAQWEATKQYFINVGYDNLVDIVELLEIELIG
ncbi:hypothetical protein ES705_24318 [subsurface metagenome]